MRSHSSIGLRPELKDLSENFNDDNYQIETINKGFNLSIKNKNKSRIKINALS